MVCKLFGKDVVKSVREKETERGEEREGKRRRKKKREVHIQTPNPLAFAKMTNAGTEA